MKNRMRIFLLCFVLLGGTAIFGYWSINQFNQAFDNLNTSYLANTNSVYPFFKKDAGLASTSPEILMTLATSTDPKLSFTFPQKDTEVYVGCTYPISWQSSAMISSLEAALIDAGMKEAMGPIASGLARENKIEPNSQSLDWKVGVVWPGAYYITVSKINGVEAEFRSKVFKINEMPKGIDKKEKLKICGQ